MGKAAVVHGRVTAQDIAAATFPGRSGPPPEFRDVVAYAFWHDLYRPVVRRLPFGSVSWHFDRVRYTGLRLDEQTGCRSISRLNRPDQLEYFSAIEGSVAVHLLADGADAQVVELPGDVAILGVAPGCRHHTTAPEAATVDSISCFLRVSSDDTYDRSARCAFTSGLDADSWKGHSLAEMFTGEAEEVWKLLDDECLRLAEAAAAGRD